MYIFHTSIEDVCFAYIIIAHSCPVYCLLLNDQNCLVWSVVLRNSHCNGRVSAKCHGIVGNSQPASLWH